MDLSLLEDRIFNFSVIEKGKDRAIMESEYGIKAVIENVGDNTIMSFSKGDTFKRYIVNNVFEINKLINIYSLFGEKIYAGIKDGCNLLIENEKDFLKAMRSFAHYNKMRILSIDGFNAVILDKNGEREFFITINDEKSCIFFQEKRKETIVKEFSSSNFSEESINKALELMVESSIPLSPASLG